MNRISTRGRGKRSEIKKRIVEWIEREGLSQGDQILSQIQLAAAFETTEVTIHRALTELAEEGVIERIKGRGTFVGPRFGRGNALQTVCFVLPGEDLDKPEKNPCYWLYVQTILRAFIQSATGHSLPFTVRAVKQGERVEEVAEQIEHHRAVFFTYTQEPGDLIRYLIDRQRVPVVTMGRPAPDLSCLTIDHDRILGAQQAVERLCDLGYSRIGFVGSQAFWGALSYEGFESGLKAAGHIVERKRVLRLGESVEETQSAVEDLLQYAKDTDALFVDSDLRSLRVLDKLQQMGVNVPEDLGLVSYDGLDYTTMGPPYLTAVRIPYDRMIGAALDEVERLGRRHTERKHIELLGSVVEGKTTCRQSGKALTRAAG